MNKPLTQAQYRSLVAKKARRNKYGSTKYVTADGIEHASKKQGLRWMTLNLQQKGGEIRNLRREVTYPLVVKDHKVCAYVADHVYERRWVDGFGNGEAWDEVIEDVKSPITRKNRAYRIKLKLMKALYGITITEV